MRPSPMSDIDQDYKSLVKLIHIMRDDPVINEKIIAILEMDSFQRRTVINNWLEQLRKQHAHENLAHALSCLFDDSIAAKVLTIISHRLS